GKLPKPVAQPVLIGPGDWDVSEVRWTRHGIFFLRNEGGATTLSLLRSPKGEAVQWLPAEGQLRGLTFDQTGHRLTLLREDITRPADVWVGTIAELADARASRALKQITFSLMGGVKPELLSSGEMVTYESFDRKKIQALVVKPRVARLGSPP